MKNRKLSTWLLYTSMLVLFCVFSYFLFQNGKHLSSANHSNHIAHAVSSDGLSSESYQMFINSVQHNIAEPSAMLLLQIISILLVSRVFGFIFAKIGQPTVIGEILAGIALGPSLLGHFSPDVFNFLYAAKSLGNLNILSQIGLVLFMFTIGLELNMGELKAKMGKIYVISHASIFLPFALGMLLAYFVYIEFASTYTEFVSFALFIGISMSITAFPVLARIIQEKGLTRTHLGALAIASAAIDDVTAWCLLAGVIAIAKTGSFVSSLYTILFSVLYVCVMFFVFRPFLKRIGEIYQNNEVINKSVIAFLLLILILSSFATQAIGIHALFGAFIAGVIMPQIPHFRKLLIDKIEDLSVTLLLPLFFVFTGLRTEIGLLNTPHLWFICIAFISVAVIGKFCGGAFSAKILGETWKDSLSIGALMNTRGLMELIVLNIGYEMGILPPPIFVMLVIMALVTTFMTSPLLSLINYIFPSLNVEDDYNRQQAQGIFKALIAVGNPENGKNLLNIAKAVLDGTKNSLAVTVLHLTPGADTNPIYGEQFATDSFKHVREEAQLINTPIETEYKVTDNVELEIIKTNNYNNYDFLLVGAGVSLSGIPFIKESKLFESIRWLNKLINTAWQKQAFLYPGTLLKDKTRYFIENSNCSVGVFVNRGFKKITSTVVLLEDETDAFLLRYARRLLRNNAEIHIEIVDISKLASSSKTIRSAIHDLKSQFPSNVRVAKFSRFNSVSLSKFSFMLISYGTWNKLALSEKKELEFIPSTLIINKKVSRFHLGAQHQIITHEDSDSNGDNE